MRSLYGFSDLKKIRSISETEVECPVLGCGVWVPRMRRGGVDLDSKGECKRGYCCVEHGIFISPSTFEYVDELDNLLWRGDEDRELLRRIKGVKRECRMGRENSEDAATWNVFRFLERENLLGSVLSSLAGLKLVNPEIVYWSYSQREWGTYSLLNEARKEFGEAVNRGSEPDLIILAENALLFIEAKLMAGNETDPSDPNNLKRYPTGGDAWMEQVFAAGFQEIVIDHRKYELFRFWLLGTWMARRLGVDFRLVNLVLGGREVDIEERFKPLIRENGERRFMRVTWEDIRDRIGDFGTAGESLELMGWYFREKSLGYGGDGRLVRGFGG